jgi:hypothetical protein
MLVSLIYGRGLDIGDWAWRSISGTTFSLAIRAVGNLALEFVSGEPHSMLRNVGGFMTPRRLRPIKIRWQKLVHRAVISPESVREPYEPFALGIERN